CDVDGVAAAEQAAQVDLEARHAPDRCPRDGGRLVVREHDGVLGTDPAAGRTTALAVVLVLNHQTVQRIDAVDAEQAEIETLHAVGAAAVVDDGIPAPLWRGEQLLRREPRRLCLPVDVDAELHQGRAGRGVLLLPCLVPVATLGGDAAHLLDVGNVTAEVAQVEAVDATVGDADGTDALRRLRLLARLCFLLLVVAGGLELALAEVSLDAVAVEQPEGGARIKPR